MSKNDTVLPEETVKETVSPKVEVKETTSVKTTTTTATKNTKVGASTMAVNISPTKKIKLQMYLMYYPQSTYVEIYLRSFYATKMQTVSDWDATVEKFLNTVYN